MGNTETEEILRERELTHGKFSELSNLAQALKCTMRLNIGWNLMKPDQKEALELIQTKIARIINGKSSFRDHWDDIAGYATLIADRLKSAKGDKLGTS